MRKIEDLTVIEPSEYKEGTFALLKCAKRPRGNQQHKNGCKYKDVICAFDIETTRLTSKQSELFAGEKGCNEQAIMFCWQFTALHHFDMIGRTWNELHYFFKLLCDELEDNEKLVIYVHNLSYEFQFLRAIYEWSKDEVFCVDSRKILKATMFDKLEFRCSYLHTNMSLSLFTSKMKVKHQKQSGEDFDYTKIRYPWTPLEDNECKYAIYDTHGLCEGLEVEMSVDKDTLYTIPLTSTGYVRRDAKKALYKYARTTLKDILPDAEIFEMLHEAFAGGDTHANRHCAGKVLYNVQSADRSSSYPDVQCNNRFPISDWTKIKGRCTFERLCDLINVKDKAVVARVSFTNIRLKDIHEGCPYISVSHCRKVRLKDGLKDGTVLLDNGRILECDYLETTITDIDLRIILQQYTMDDVAIIECAFSSYGELPRELKEVAIDYYTKKTSLKGIDDMEILYFKAKNKLNAIYGMTAQNPAKQSIFYCNGEYIQDDKTTLELLEQAYKKAFITYAWGVWTTANARWELHRGIDLVTSQGALFVYCDTDSVKYIGDVDWSEYNNEKIRNSTKSGAFATDSKGVSHYMGVYEDDGHYYEFATLGAKKYCYSFGAGPMQTHVTIAGVTKSKGGAELDEGDKYGVGVYRFAQADKHSFTFKKAGGTEIRYQDDPTVKRFTAEGHTMDITPNAVIRDSTYTLGITAEYENILLYHSLGLDNWAVI